MQAAIRNSSSFEDFENAGVVYSAIVMTAVHTSLRMPYDLI
ncbi:hypothetical protein IL54_0435 [Sphingobium sp. ba1]|nr:hypothetical protein IL54_0435 [Sphingobium sp. ba1]